MRTCPKHGRQLMRLYESEDGKTGVLLGPSHPLVHQDAIRPYVNNKNEKMRKLRLVFKKLVCPRCLHDEREHARLSIFGTRRAQRV